MQKYAKSYQMMSLEGKVTPFSFLGQHTPDEQTLKVKS